MGVNSLRLKNQVNILHGGGSARLRKLVVLGSIFCAFTNVLWLGPVSAFSLNSKCKLSSISWILTAHIAERSVLQVTATDPWAPWESRMAR